MQEQPIISAIDRKLIKAELTQERLLRTTNKAGNEIYIINAHNSPNTMREIGRLREWAFRESGGGTGKSLDNLAKIPEGSVNISRQRESQF